MVGVALALSGFVGVYLTSYLATSSRVTSLAIIDSGLLKLGDNVYFHVTLRNIGTVPFKIVDVSIHFPGGYYSTSQSLSIVVAPGATISITEQDLSTYFKLDPRRFEPGSSYLVRVFVETGGAQSVHSTVVTCQG